jgi:signal transduction histidine kinase
MRIATSLRNRIFLACTLLASLSLGFVFYFVNVRTTEQADAELRSGLAEAASIVDQQRLTQLDNYTRMARLVTANRVTLMAAVATDDPPTVQPLADGFRQELNADVLLVSNAKGRVLAASGSDADALPIDVSAASSDDEVATFVAHNRGILQVTSVPIFYGPEQDVLGRLTLGFFLDDARANQFKRLTGSDIAFGAGGRIVASTIPVEGRSALAAVLNAPDITHVTVGGEEFLAFAGPIHPDPPAAGPSGGPEPRIVVLRSRTERLRFLTALRAALGGAFIVTVALATLAGYGIARTVTRPLAAVTTAMREVAATGDLTRKVLLRSRAWDDEDARVLATAFNTLTESIARFQREAAQKERLSSLGRLSTVIAHEVRNPLMIIRAALTTLTRDELTRGDIREAVADIDDETKRLNRVVTEVLDFAKPMRFELAPASLNDLCRASVVAAWEGKPGDEVELDLDEEMPLVQTDAERLRTALVNVLGNARQAVEARVPGRPGINGRGADVMVKTRRDGGRVRITITDRGIGITPEHMAHIFDPYFTTRRAGTGLGLPIARNIVDGLGGSITLASHAGQGTEITIDLPLTAAGAAA